VPDANGDALPNVGFAPNAPAPPNGEAPKAEDPLEKIIIERI
jgi:hypothetical protein